MTTQKFEEIKDKIEDSKQAKARAEGAIEKIEEQWKADFEVTTLEEAEEKLAELNKTIKKDEAKLEALMTDLEDITDWNAV